MAATRQAPEMSIKQGTPSTTRGNPASCKPGLENLGFRAFAV